MAHVTLDLSKYDALTAYKGLPDEKEENPARFFPDTSSVRRCVRERMSVMGLDAAELARRAGVPLSSAEELVETGLTSIRYVYRMFDLLHIRTETLPSAYAGRLLGGNCTPGRTGIMWARSRKTTRSAYRSRTTRTRVCRSV